MHLPFAFHARARADYRSTSSPWVGFRLEAFHLLKICLLHYILVYFTTHPLLFLSLSPSRPCRVADVMRLYICAGDDISDREGLSLPLVNLFE